MIRYGRLTIVAGQKTIKGRISAICDCGEITTVRLRDLKRGVTKSCGCLKYELAHKNLMKGEHEKHGLRNHPIYSRHQGIMARCYRPGHTNYPAYGGRGITVAKEWHDVKTFYEAVGDPPGWKTYELDRIDNDKGYEPGNVQWLQERKHREKHRKLRKLDAEKRNKVS